MSLSQQQFRRIVACIIVLALTTDVVAFSGNKLSFKSASNLNQRSSLEMYVPKPSGQPSSSEVARQMIPNPTSIAPSIRAVEPRRKQNEKKKNQRRYTTELSNSVLADCNTLPSFPTAHGLLSPETVMRMEEMIGHEGRSSAAVDDFLRQYRRHGPMSCLSMLSDPDVLPHLTKAMRDVV